jgi:hypothetical protein
MLVAFLTAWSLAASDLASAQRYVIGVLILAGRRRHLGYERPRGINSIYYILVLWRGKAASFFKKG